MVIRMSYGPKGSILQRTILRQILREANYESKNLSAGGGPENLEARNIVRRMKAAMIGADNYPLSKNTIELSRLSGVDVWEDEGGAIEGDPKYPVA